jgi:chemotaxis protein MotB
MGLLVSFFVMLVAFSSQDSQKVAAVTGSMREAFGVQKDHPQVAGVVELEGLATRRYLKYAGHVPPEYSSLTPTPDQNGQGLSDYNALAQAAVSLRQALQEFPELTEASKHIVIEETKEGLNISLVDQNGQSMFPQGSSVPYKRMHDIVQALAGPLKATPYRVAITGHTATDELDYGSRSKWALSVDRANAVRKLLEEQGYPSANFFKVTGRADSDPMFPDDPSVAPNRRITITLIREAPPVPVGLQP